MVRTVVQTSVALGALVLNASAFDIPRHSTQFNVAGTGPARQTSQLTYRWTGDHPATAKCCGVLGAAHGARLNQATLLLATGDNPLNRNDEERARINDLIAILLASPEEAWKPDVLDPFVDILLTGALYRQTMDDRQAKVRSAEEQEVLTKVDAFLSGYLSVEMRRASRRKVSDILKSAIEGPAALDRCLKSLASNNQLDGDLKDYLSNLVETKSVMSSPGSPLLKVLKTVKARVDAEDKAVETPEIRILAQALTFDNPSKRQEYLTEAFATLEELDDFVKFVQHGIDYFGNETGFAMRSNMPSENLYKMKAIYADAAAIRRQYLK